MAELKIISMDEVQSMFHPLLSTGLPSDCCASTVGSTLICTVKVIIKNIVIYQLLFPFLPVSEEKAVTV